LIWRCLFSGGSVGDRKFDVVEVAGFEKGRGFGALSEIVGAAVVQNQAVLDGPGGGVFGGGGNGGLSVVIGSVVAG